MWTPMEQYEKGLISLDELVEKDPMVDCLWVDGERAKIDQQQAEFEAEVKRQQAVWSQYETEDEEWVAQMRNEGWS